MSDTAPKDQRSLLYGHVQTPIAREPRTGEAVWQLTKEFMFGLLVGGVVGYVVGALWANLGPLKSLIRWG